MAIAFGWVNDAGNGFVAANTSFTTSAGGNTINSGDLLVVMGIVNANVGAITPASGFNPMDTARVDGNPREVALFSKVAGASETGAYPFSWTGSNFFAWSLMCFTGAHATTPIDQVATNIISGSTNFTTASITPTGTADFLVTVFTSDGAAFTGPGGMAVNVNNVVLESGTSGYMVTTEQLASASSVSRTATTGVAKNGTTMILALTPASTDVLMSQIWM